MVLLCFLSASICTRFDFIAGESPLESGATQEERHRHIKNNIEVRPRSAYNRTPYCQNYEGEICWRVWRDPLTRALQTAWRGYEFARQAARCNLGDVGVVTVMIFTHIRAQRHTFFILRCHGLTAVATDQRQNGAIPTSHSFACHGRQAKITCSAGHMYCMVFHLPVE